MINTMDSVFRVKAFLESLQTYKQYGMLYRNRYPDFERTGEIEDWDYFEPWDKAAQNVELQLSRILEAVQKRRNSDE